MPPPHVLQGQPLDKMVYVQNLTINPWPDYFRAGGTSEIFLDPTRPQTFPENHPAAGHQVIKMNPDAPAEIIDYFNLEDDDEFVQGDYLWEKSEFWGGRSFIRRKIARLDNEKPHIDAYLEKLSSYVSQKTTIKSLLPSFEQEYFGLWYRIPDSRTFKMTLGLDRDLKLEKVTLKIGTTQSISSREGWGMYTHVSGHIAQLELS